MGRPLFIPKVENDLLSEKTASQGRSTIRRNNRSQSAVQRLPHAISSGSFQRSSRRFNETSDRPQGSTDEAVSTSNSSSRVLNDVDLHYQLELLEASNARRLRMAAQASQATPHYRYPHLSRRLRDLVQDEATARRLSSRNLRHGGDETARQDSDALDGLGDRDRSLSPEDHHVGWDTLLATLTPDPQPPSVSSSFTSTRVSQSAVGSATTSFTEPDRVPEPVPAADPGCESGEERDHSDAEEDEDLDIALSSGFRRHIPRSHPVHGSRTNTTSTSESEDDSHEEIINHIRRVTRRRYAQDNFWEQLEALHRQLYH